MFLFQFFIAVLLQASAHAESRLVLGTPELTPTTIDEVTAKILPGSIVLVSEIHDYPPHGQHQVEVMRSLRTHGHKVSAGLEFFTFDHQQAVNRFLRGELNEVDFLREVQWGKSNFAHYRDQALFPREAEGKTLAINAPQALVRKIKTSGLNSLSTEERAMLPPQFALGNALYRERFTKVIRDHAPDKAAIQRHFEAQSVWDDTMAFTSCSYVQKYPDQVLVVVVGDFHVTYGGGLPDRIHARGCDRLVTISQTYSKSVYSSAADQLALPSPRYGQRSEYVWLSDDPLARASRKKRPSSKARRF
ncbi:MAG: ChaN family lipoprotein [Bdellovibrionales bacterium]|nr:ChaN family lipoprotein [Bdellovibrionales bacterium]